MRLGALPFLLYPILPFFRVSLAVFADEAYQVDFHHALLGPPQAHTTFFHRPSAISKASLLYTLSEELVLGAVNPKDGAVLWRQPLANRAHNTTSRGHLKAGAGANTIISAVDGIVQAWDAVDGRLAWAWKGPGSVKALEVLDAAEGEADVLVLSEEDGTGAVVRRLAALTGDIMWESRDTSGELPYSVITSKDSIFYLSLRSALLKGFRIKAVELTPSTGKPIAHPTLFNSESELSSEDLILYAGSNAGVPIIVWTDKALKSVKVSAITTKHTTTITRESFFPSDGQTVKEIHVHTPRTTASQPHFLVHFQSAESHWAHVYHLDVSTGAALKAYDLPRVDGKGAFSLSTPGSEVCFVRHTTSRIILISSTKPDVLGQWEINPKSLAIVHAASEVVSRGGSKYSLRSALTLPSGDWELVRNGDSLWTRPDGLTGVVAAAFVDIRKEEGLEQELAAESQTNILSAYTHRLKRHAKDLQYLPGWVETLPNRITAAFLGEKGAVQAPKLRRDGFGFRKIVVVATERGRLATLDTGNQGKVVWNVQAVNLQAGSKWGILGIEVEDTTLLVRGQSGEFLRVQSDTGSIMQHQPADLVPSLQTTVPVIDARSRQVLIPINNDGSIGTLPEAEIGDGVVVVTQRANGIVTGWNLDTKEKPSVAWEFSPSTGEKVHSVTPRPAHDPVASIGKALGDRNVLYKYLNPNLLLITTVAVKASMVTFYLVDSISGTILHSITHANVDIDQPISYAISENFFAYSLFSETTTAPQDPSQLDQQKLRGYQLVVSELYESPFPNERMSGSSSNSSALHPLPSDEIGSYNAPHVISQTYLIPSPISHMSMTSTLQGITPRSLLCVMPRLNTLVSIPRHILDPRRPIGRDATAAEAEEGLFRYNAVMDFDARWTLTHNRDLISMSTAISSPSLLESTSLVLSFGDMDIFGTRVSPIGGFDILGKGFSKIQLVGTVVALAIGTSVLAPFVRKKQIDGQWKA